MASRFKRLARLALLLALAGAGALGPGEAAAGRNSANNDGSGPGAARAGAHGRPAARYIVLHIQDGTSPSSRAAGARRAA